MAWHIAVNSIQQVGDDAHISRVALRDPGELETAIFQPSSPADAWLGQARHTEVQAVASRVDLSIAEEIGAPSKRTDHA